MRKRVRMKRAREFSALFTVGLILDHARPSFFREARRKRAQLVQWFARKKLRTSIAHADAVKRVYLRTEAP